MLLDGDVRERLELILRSIRDLNQWRICQEVLVRSVLEPQEVLVKTGLDPVEEPEKNHRKEEDLELCGERREQRGWDLHKNVQLMKEQLKCLRRRDAGLLSQLQELDEQIHQLRLDTHCSHDTPETPESCDRPPDTPEGDSRPSSGFYELSDGASGSLCNSVFSLCSTLDSDTPALTTSPSAEAPPTVTGVTGVTPHGVFNRSLSSPPSSFSPPSSSSSFPPSFTAAPSSRLSPQPQKHLDQYISSLLQRRAHNFRTNQRRTTLDPIRTSPDQPKTLQRQTSLTNGALVLLKSPKQLGKTFSVSEEAAILDQQTNQNFSEISSEFKSTEHTGTLNSYEDLLKLNGVKKPSRSGKKAVIFSRQSVKTKANKQTGQASSGHGQRKTGKNLDKINSNLKSGRVIINHKNSEVELKQRLRKDKLRDLEESPNSNSIKIKWMRSTKSHHRSQVSLMKTMDGFSFPTEFQEQGDWKVSQDRTSRRSDVEEEVNEEEQTGAGEQRKTRSAVWSEVRRRRRRGGSEQESDRASVWSKTVKSRHHSVKPRHKLSQSQASWTGRQPIREKQSICEAGQEVTDEDTESEGEQTGRGGNYQNKACVRIKASRNLKKRILRLRSGSGSGFRIITTV